jgi:hypothetical protein
MGGATPTRMTPGRSIHARSTRPYCVPMAASDVMTRAGAMRVGRAKDPGGDSSTWTDILRAMAVRKRLEEMSAAQAGKGSMTPAGAMNRPVAGPTGQQRAPRA